MTKNVSYRLQFIDSAIFMASLLSNLANNLAEGIHEIKWKYGHDNKKFETCGVKYKDCKCFRKYKNFEDNLIKYKCLFCYKNYQKKFDENLKKLFLNIYRFSNNDIIGFLSLLWKCVYPYEKADF